ncbi:histidine phosphatase family protein [Pseudomonas sp.]|uniref:lipopolysaccharide core heptose(II)-phosphate phosphatase PmrG n=1 Tax=Pseudomonas sp. TaxID=306 RepID=UPI003FD7B5EF
MNKNFNDSRQANKKKASRVVKIKALMVIAALLLLCFTAYVALKTPRPSHFFRGSSLEIASFKAAWIEGDVIAFVRHAERCDQSTAPCLNSLDGITVRGKGVAIEVGASFQQLGLEKTDILTSPLTRTQQTADYMFNHKVQSQEWLANCKNTILQSAIKHKVRGRNLVLVTHSDCMKDVERSMNYSTSDKPDYSSSLIISYREKEKVLQMLGIVDSGDWKLSL